MLAKLGRENFLYKGGEIMIQGSPIKVMGPTQHIVETVDHILFIVIFTFISHVSKALFYHLNLSIYISVTGSLYTHSPNTQTSFILSGSC